jgi:hypothetical protein
MVISVTEFTEINHISCDIISGVEAYSFGVGSWLVVHLLCACTAYSEWLMRNS